LRVARGRTWLAVAVDRLPRAAEGREREGRAYIGCCAVDVADWPFPAFGIAAIRSAFLRASRRQFEKCRTTIVFNDRLIVKILSF